MQGYVDHLANKTRANDKFRDVLYTGENLQLVLMTLAPGEDIGAEVHDDHDQFFRVETGTGEAMIDERTETVKSGDGVIVPAGARHNVTNTGTEPLRLYTIYSPPEHKDGVAFDDKADADASDEHFDGKTTE